jgi:hypothetical protein
VEILKIIFLDIDGVLNAIDFQMDSTDEPPLIDRSRLVILKEIIEKSDAKVVLSSSWKKAWFPKCKFDILFRESGIIVHDITPSIGRKRDEISAWLNEHPETKSFAIIDDAEGGWGELLPYVVITDPLNTKGLEPEHINKVLQLLG